MLVSIIGNGNMAKGLATRFLAGGHTVGIHARDTAKGSSLRDELIGNGANADKVSVTGMSGKVGDMLIPTVHYGEEMQAVAKQYASAAAGKVVVDISNPVDFSTFQLIPKPGISGAEEVAKLFPGAKVVKAFNTIFSATLTTGKVHNLPLDVFMAGDDDGAKSIVAALITDSGMRPLDCGPLANARHLEGIELLHMNLQEQIQGNWASAIKILT